MALTACSADTFEGTSKSETMDVIMVQEYQKHLKRKIGTENRADSGSGLGDSPGGGGQTPDWPSIHRTASRTSSVAVFTPSFCFMLAR